MQTTSDRAAELVHSLLQDSIDNLKMLRPLELPVLFSDCTIWSPDPKDCTSLVEHRADWTGLAVGVIGGNTSYWFIGKCVQTHERQFVCLGTAESIEQLVTKATDALARGLDYWGDAARGETQTLGSCAAISSASS